MQHIPIHVFTEHGCDTKASELNSEFQGTRFLKGQNRGEIVSQAILLFLRTTDALKQAVGERNGVLAA